MNFRPAASRDELEINLIPLIDVLLVILIFLAATTSFTRISQIQIALPQARVDAPRLEKAIDIAISQEGIYALDGQLIEGHEVGDIAAALRQALDAGKEGVVIIDADAQASHESVVRVLEAARRAGIERVNFATRTAP